MELALFAMRDESTRGRRYPEAPHPYRSDYQRDRDRVIHSKAFRRLEKKTQVFDPDYSDHFRNRLTHTLEVTQISRTIGQGLRLNTDLCEVLALSHDIGHPPFSHEGEKILDRLMKECGSGFDHNLHALRIVEYFEEKYPAFPGLNLTFEVREGIVKHSRDYSGEDVLYVDVGEYCLGLRPPLEAQVIDLADEIAYNLADLDDGFSAGLIGAAEIAEEVELFRDLYRQVGSGFPQVSERLRVAETLRRMMDSLVSDLIENTRQVLEGRQLDSVESVRRFPERLPAFSPAMGLLNRQVKEFLHRKLYSHPRLLEARQRAQHVVERLFLYYRKHPRGLPPKHFSRIGEQGLERVVCDYIAGMTDPFAESSFQSLFH